MGKVEQLTHWRVIALAIPGLRRRLRAMLAGMLYRITVGSGEIAG